MAIIGEISALSAALMWSATSFIFTDATIKLGALTLNISRMTLACIYLITTILIFHVNYQLDERQIIFLILSGVIGLALGDSFLFKSFSLIGPRITLLIYSCNPAIAAIIAFIVLGEYLSLWSIAGMLITICGIFIVILEKQVHNHTKFKISKTGLVYSFIGAAGQAIGLILSKIAYQGGEINGLTATFVRLFGALIVLLPLAAFTSKLNNPIKIIGKEKRLLLMIIFGSLIGPYLGITLSFLAIIYTKVGIASTLLSTMPIMMLPMSRLIYKEKLSIKSIAGAFITVSGIAILFLL